MSTPNTPSSPQNPDASSRQEGVGQYTPQPSSPGYADASSQSAPYGGTHATQQLPPAYAEQYSQQYTPQQSYQPAAAKPQLPTTMGQTNTFAVLTIIFAFISPLAGIIFGHLALGQIKRNGDAGRGIGLTGLIISYAYFVFVALFFIVYIGFIIVMFGAMGAAFSELGSLDSGSPTF